MIRRIAQLSDAIRLARITWPRWKKEIRQRTRRRRRRSIPETPPMRIFSSAARARLTRLARDRPLSLPAVNSCVCVRCLPSFLPSSFSLSLPLRVRVTARTAELRTYYASIEFYFNSKSSLEISEHVSAKVRIHSVCKINV